MGIFLVVDMENSKVVDSFEKEMDAWLYIGRLEHELCEKVIGLPYDEADKIVRARYRIYAAVL